MKMAVICARVSSDDPKHERLADQLAECRRYADEHDYRVVGEIVENGVSGGLPLEKRPDLWRAVEQLKAGRVQAIIVRELDRLGRRLDTQALVEELQQYQDGVLFVRQPRQDDPEAEIIQLGLGGVMARLERARIYRRTSQGRNRRAREGKTTIGKLPRWLTAATDGGFALVEDEARKVKAILDAYGTVGAHSAAADAGLNPSSVVTILTNPAVAGRRYIFPLASRTMGRAEHQRARRAALREVTLASTVGDADAIAEQHGLIVQEVPALITWERFAEIQSRLATNGAGQRGRPPKPENRLPLQGRVRCAVHDLAYTPHRPGSGVIHAECTARRGHNARVHGKCELPRLSWIEDTRGGPSLLTLVQKAYTAATKSPAAIRRANQDRLAQVTAEIDQMEATTGDLDGEVERLRDRKAKLALLWADGDLPDDRWQQEKARLDREIADRERRRARLSGDLTRLADLKTQREIMEAGFSMAVLFDTDARFVYGNDVCKAAERLDLRVTVHGDRLQIDGLIPFPDIPLTGNWLDAAPSHRNFTQSESVSAAGPGAPRIKEGETGELIRFT